MGGGGGGGGGGGWPGVYWRASQSLWARTQSASSSRVAVVRWPDPVGGGGRVGLGLTFVPAATQPHMRKARSHRATSSYSDREFD